MKLTIASLEKDLVHVAVEGDVTANDLPVSGHNPLADVLGQNFQAGRIMIDLSKVPMMGSAGLGWLLSTARAVKAAGGRLAVHSPRPAVAEAFQLIRADRLLKVASDEAAARAAVTA